jgi:N-acetylmuramoyl-L-alanine amidase
MRFSATRAIRAAPRSSAAASLAALLVVTLSGCGSHPDQHAADARTTSISPSQQPVATSVSPSPSAKPTTSVTATHRLTSASANVSKPTVSSSAPSSVSSSPTAMAGSRSVAGLTVVLNPGHDGGNEANAAAINKLVPAGFGETKACDTTGTNTTAGYTEHAFNWDVSLRVRTILRAHRVKVVMTRTSDTGVGPCVDARAAIGNQKGVAAVISIHADGTTDGVGHGFHVCEDSRQPAGPAVAALSHALTVAVHNSLVKTSGLTTSTYLGSNGYYPRSDLAALNLATTPSTFLELGNMRNAGDAAEQSSPDGRQRLAASVANGILAWLANP